MKYIKFFNEDIKFPDGKLYLHFKMGTISGGKYPGLESFFGSHGNVIIKESDKKRIEYILSQIQIKRKFIVEIERLYDGMNQISISDHRGKKSTPVLRYRIVLKQDEYFLIRSKNSIDSYIVDGWDGLESFIKDKFNNEAS